ncbi:MAG: alpha/beta hydrolase [Rhodoferax sp.]|nr:alpha/beta hydrolase [Rhodoferax sp.]
MSEPKLNYLVCPDQQAGHRMAYWEWGDAQAAHVVVCVHGLTRQGRDFDVLARALLATASHPIRVVCPDVVGRGMSERLADPVQYQLPTYVSDMLTLVAALRPLTLDWVGTSMGGLIGMAVCGQSGLPLATPVRRMVLNDVGPVIEWKAIARIGSELGRTLRFDSVQQAADALWAVSSSFGPHTPEQWLEFSRPMVNPAPDGQPGVVLHYDPAIVLGVRAVTQEAAAQGEAMLWTLYDAIRAESLLLRGADSDLLSRETAQAMTQRGPKAELVEWPGVGHAPTLIDPGQVQTVTSFLLK